MHTKPSILIFSLAYVPFVGGAELAVKEITDRLPDYTFHLITYRFDSTWRKEEIVGNVRVFRVGRGKRGGSYYGRTFEKFLFMPLAFFKALQLHWKYHYRIFWPLMASRASAPALLMKILYPRVPLFLTIQEGDTRAYAYQRLGVLAPLWRKVFSSADTIQVISEYLKKFSVEEGAHPERIIVIPNGIDENIFSDRMPESEKNTLRKTLGILPDTKVIVTASRLVPKNGVDILLEAVSALKLRGTNVNVKVLIIGKGPEEGRLKRLAGISGIDTLFLGTVQNDELLPYLAISNIFIRPSRSEGLGTAFLEAMAVGIPVIGTNVGGIPDFLTDNVTGIFAKSENPDDLADKIDFLLSHPELTKTLVQNASRLIQEKYRWDTIAENFSDVFKKFLSAPKPILIVSGIFKPDIGGSATYSETVLRELPRYGFMPALLTYGDHEASDTTSVIRVSRAYPKGARHLVFFWKCLILLRHSDMVLSVDASMGGGLPARLAAFLLHKPFVVRITGEYAWEQGQARFSVKDSLDIFQNKKYPLPVEILRYIEHWIVRSARRVIAPSEYLKMIAVGWGVPEKRISVIYNTIQKPEGETVTKEDARHELNLPESVPIILSSGRLVLWKGFRELIQLMPRIAKDIPDIRLVIIGNGPERNNLEALIHDLQLENSVFLQLAVSPERLFIYLRASDVFVLNSSYEGFSHILVEALMAETPVVATDVGGNPEIISYEKNGMLVSHGNVGMLQGAIVRILKDHDFAKDLVRHGTETIREFSVEKMMDGLQSIFHSII